MASRLAVLSIVAATLLGGCAPAVGSAIPGSDGCLTCHPAHNEQIASCAYCHRGDSGARREALGHHRLLRGRAAEHGLADSPAVNEGRHLVESLGCRRCHEIDGKGNRLATSLDRSAWKRDQAELERSIREPVENMERFGLSARQTEAVVAFLLHDGDPASAEATYRVRFAREGHDAARAFDTLCGGCHRALLARGPTGRGSAGPNLSGLFTPHYRVVAEEQAWWSPALLRKWLRNPRSIRLGAAMRPLRLTEAELVALIDELGNL